jgi:hypothetical protein
VARGDVAVTGPQCHVIPRASHFPRALPLPPSASIGAAIDRCRDWLSEIQSSRVVRDIMDPIAEETHAAEAQPVAPEVQSILDALNRDPVVTQAWRDRERKLAETSSKDIERAIFLFMCPMDYVTECEHAEKGNTAEIFAVRRAAGLTWAPNADAVAGRC